MKSLKVKTPADQGSQSKPKFKKSQLLVFLLAVALIAGSGFGAYYWQHHKLTNANKQITSLDSSNKDLNTKLTDLQSKYSQAQKELNGYKSANSLTQADLSLVVDNAAYIYPFYSISRAPGYLGIQLTFTNSNSAPIYLSKGGFKLKDQQDNVYPLLTYDPPKLPSGWVLLADQTISPGETVRGVVIFQLPNQSIKTFTLVNGTKTYVVNEG